MLLVRALLVTIAAHALGMLSMVLLLLPGMPGGGAADDAARVAYVAGHPWLWRLGWFPWQLTAASDLLLAVALLRTPRVPRLAAIVTTLVTAAAIVPDQYGQIAWMTKGIALAASAPSEYFSYEKHIFESTAVWGASLYTVGALGWTWCFVAAKTWNRSLTLLSFALWPLFASAALGPLLGVDAKLVAGANALGFVLLEIWFVLVTEAVLRRMRPDELHGRYARWHHPRFGWLDVLANSRFVRACGELVPMVAFRSDITDVTYVNYVVDAARLERLVPVGLELQHVGSGGSFAVFTFLTYRHGSLGPRFLGSLRRLLPSPVQSNWRIYVRDPRSGREGVHFVTTAIGSTPHALAARALSEGLPMHVFASAEVDPLRIWLDPGKGTAPDCDARFELTSTPVDGPWHACFSTWRDALAYVVPQDSAFSTQPWFGHVTRQEIDLDISLDECVPLAGQVESRAVRAIVGEASPFSFRIDSVRFSFRGEQHDPLPVV